MLHLDGQSSAPQARLVLVLQNRGFKAVITDQSHAERSDIVFAQSPGAGRNEQKCSTVQIFVSQGPAAVVLPNTVRLGEATARDKDRRRQLQGDRG